MTAAASKPLTPDGPASKPQPEPFMGILMLETTFPRILGDVGHPDTFPFPVRHCIVRGATTDRVVIRPDATLIDPFNRAGQDLIREGAAALTTSCGFLALFHDQLTAALDVPVFTSSLLQARLAAAQLKPGQKVGIITASKASLTRAHLSGAGIDALPLAIQGMEDAPEFTRVFLNGKTTLDQELCCREMETAALELVSRHPEVGPIVLECTNMPPYADAVRQATGRPVSDITTLLNWAWSSLSARTARVH